MRYRTKLTLTLVLLSIFTGGLVLGVFVLGSRDILFDQIRSQVLSIAATGATQIPGELERGITAEDTPAYREVQSRLRAIRDANRRKDVRIRFVYTIRPAPDGHWIYVVDAEEDAKERSELGSPVTFEGAKRPLTLGEAYAEPSFTKDEFGVWLSSYAPIKTADGKPIAMLGVDLAASDILARMNLLLWLGILGIGTASTCALLLGILLAGRATRPLMQVRDALRRIAKGDWDARADVPGKDEFAEVAVAVNQMAVSLREREMLKGALARYVSRDIADQILAQDGLAMLQGKRREISVCIVDIRNFTALSSKLSPENIVSFLNDFFGRMIDVVFGHRGTLDKFLGDGFIAIFGAPLEDPDHRASALRAAIAILKAKEEIHAEILSTYGVDLHIGIAVHTGPAVVGDIGSEQRMEYTAIGDAVNFASRIETLNKEYRTEILISESTAEGAPDDIPLRPVAEVELRGAQGSIRLYTI